MAHTKEFFVAVTQRIFSNWTALRLAVEQGMGPKQSAIEFCPYITEVLYMNERLTSSEIAMELEDYMDEQFNTELQDNSSKEVAEELLRFYQYCMESNESTATAELEKLPPLQSWLVSTLPTTSSNNHSLPVDCDSSSDDENMDEDKNVADAEGWIEVKARRKR